MRTGRSPAAKRCGRLRSKACPPDQFDKADTYAEALRKSYVPESIMVPNDTPCRYLASPPAGDFPIVLEVSMPFEPPANIAAFGRGFVLRIGADQQARSWFYAEVTRRQAGWQVKKITRLPIDE